MRTVEAFGGGFSCRRRRPCLPAPRQYNTQSSLPHLARASASTVVVLPMAVPHTSPIGDDAEPCDYQTGRDGCSSRPAHQISPAMERLVVEKLCFQSADTLAPTDWCSGVLAKIPDAWWVESRPWAC